MTAHSYVLATADGSDALYTLSFDYLDRAHVAAFVDGAAATLVWVTAASVRLATPAPAGALVRIERQTPRNARLVDFVDGAVLTEADLDRSALQSLFVAQETRDAVDGALRQGLDGRFDAQARRIGGLAAPIAADDAATKAYADTTAALAAAAASAAGGSASAASASATAASGSATAAALSASAAAQSAAEAAAANPGGALAALDSVAAAQIEDAAVTLPKIAPAARSGLGAALITGAAGAAGALAAWSGDGDLAEAPAASLAEMAAGTETGLRAMSPVLIAAAITALSAGVDGDVATFANPDDVQTFTTSGVWTKPAKAAFVLAECVGGGGSGAYPSANAGGRNGGGGGGFARRLLAAADVGATESVVVGAGMAVTYSTGKGGDSSFGSHVSAPGGHGGGYVYDGVAAPPCAPGGGGGGAGLSGVGSRNLSLYGSHDGGGAVWGGGGGGAEGRAGGVSRFGGNGGASGVAGAAPGGGGGYNAAGAAGRVVVKTWVK